jgi:hypothetical protein
LKTSPGKLPFLIADVRDGPERVNTSNPIAMTGFRTLDHAAPFLDLISLNRDEAGVGIQ